MKTAIVYAREMRGSSLDEQLALCHQLAAAENLIVVTAVVDFQSPTPAYRLGLRGVLDMVGAGDVPVVLAVSPQHLSKDPVRLQALNDMLREKNCEIRYAVTD